MSTKFPIGIGPPNALAYPIRAPAGLDLTTVTGVTFQVQAPNGALLTWIASIPTTVPPVEGEYSSLVGSPNPVSSELLFAVYPFAAYTLPSLGDVTQIGTYLVTPVLSIPGGTKPCYARPFVATTLFGM